MPFVDPDGMPAKELLQTVGLAESKESRLGQPTPSIMIARSKRQVSSVQTNRKGQGAGFTSNWDRRS